VIDESGAAQMLLPEEQAQEDHRHQGIEATIATMARIPPKSVSKDDAEVLRNSSAT
jgi:ATP-dependent Clp protease ATP-binding subunit ClpA